MINYHLWRLTECYLNGNNVSAHSLPPRHYERNAPACLHIKRINPYKALNKRVSFQRALTRRGAYYQSTNLISLLLYSPPSLIHSLRLASSLFPLSLGASMPPPLSRFLSFCLFISCILSLSLPSSSSAIISPLICVLLSLAPFVLLCYFSLFLFCLSFSSRFVSSFLDSVSFIHLFPVLFVLVSLSFFLFFYYFLVTLSPPSLSSLFSLLYLFLSPSLPPPFPFVIISSLIFAPRSFSSFINHGIDSCIFLYLFLHRSLFFPFICFLLCHGLSFYIYIYILRSPLLYFFLSPLSLHLSVHLFISLLLYLDLSFFPFITLFLSLSLVLSLPPIFHHHLFFPSTLLPTSLSVSRFDSVCFFPPFSSLSSFPL